MFPSKLKPFFLINLMIIGFLKVIYSVSDSVILYWTIFSFGPVPLTSWFSFTIRMPRKLANYQNYL